LDKLQSWLLHMLSIVGKKIYKQTKFKFSPLWKDSLKELKWKIISLESSTKQQIWQTFQNMILPF